MSKKHFIDIAKVLSDSKSDYKLCLTFAGVFKAYNDKFDINRFMKACGH